MKDLSVFCVDNSNRAEFEAVAGGYRGDIYVQVSLQFYHLYFYDMVRLKQDFETEIKYSGVYTVDPNLVLVEEVSNVKIKDVVVELYKQKYFSSIRQIDKHEVEKLNLKVLQALPDYM